MSTPVTTSIMRANLSTFSSLAKRGGLESARSLQRVTGTLMSRMHSLEVETVPARFDDFEAVWAVPKCVPRRGVILYLHGGGYCAGDLSYAGGVGSTFAAMTERRALCPAYRLAPEHPFPAALDDALAAYRLLLDTGYRGEEIVLVGESAGGGLVFALTLLLRERGFPLPAALVPISPWTDLTLSGSSIERNESRDPSLTPELLEFYVNCYLPDESLAKNPLVSPLLADLHGLPPCHIFAGGDELILSDITRIHEKLLISNVDSRLTLGEGLWHSWPLYHIKEAQDAMREISDFITEKIET